MLFVAEATPIILKHPETAIIFIGSLLTLVFGVCLLRALEYSAKESGFYVGFGGWASVSNRDQGFRLFGCMELQISEFRDVEFRLLGFWICRRGVFG